MRTDVRPPRLLFIAFYYPPSRASGVYRSRATANELAAAGWDVTVVTPQREFFRDYTQAFDPSLETTVHPDIRVERVPFGGPRWESDIRRFSWLRGNFPQLTDQVYVRRERLLFPEPYAPWILPVVRRAVGLHRHDPFDLVLATGNPHAAFAAAWGIHRLTGLPYAIDYRDAWTLNVYDGTPMFPPGHRAHGWERRILGRAAQISFVNEPIRGWHQERYPEVADRMIVVENGFEPELLGDLVDAGDTGEDRVRPLRFGYLGTLTRWVPLEELLAGWRLAQQHDILRGAEVRLHGYLGYFHHGAGPVQETLARHADLPVAHLGGVPKAQVASVYNSLDVLVLAITGSRFVTSGKVYEYMATGKPIVSVHDPACAASDTLRDYPLWFPARDLSPESVRDALLAGAEAARRLTAEDVRAAREFASRYTRGAQLAALERALRCEVEQRGLATVDRR